MFGGEGSNIACGGSGNDRMLDNGLTGINQSFGEEGYDLLNVVSLSGSLLDGSDSIYSPMILQGMAGLITADDFVPIP